MSFRKLPITLVVVWIGGQGEEPPVRENLRLAPVMGGIKVRLS